MIGVIGSSGFIGCHLMNALGDNAVSINLRSESDGKIIEKLKKLSVKKIIHLASPTPSPGIEEFTTIIRELAERVLSIVKEVGVEQIIVISSIRVHPNGLEKFENDSKIDPIDDYGSGKIEMERIFSRSNIPIITLRLSSVQGLNSEGEPKGVVGAFSKQILNDNCARVMGDGKAKKDLIHVSDVVNLITELLHDNYTQMTFTSPVGGDNCVTVLQLAEQMIRKSDGDIQYTRAADYELSGCVDNECLKKIVTWRPEWGVEQIIDESLSRD